jgi:hypothetical protein
MDNQKSYIKAQTTQWPKDKEQNDIQVTGVSVSFAVIRRIFDQLTVGCGNAIILCFLLFCIMRTTQWPKDKEQNDIQNITQKTKDRATSCVDTDHLEG